MKAKRIGVDFDGTLADSEFAWRFYLRTKNMFLTQLLSLFAKPKIKKIHTKFVVITSRRKQDAWCTYLWLWLHGFSPKVYFTEVAYLDNPLGSYKAKADLIVSLDLDVYIEDDMKFVDYFLDKYGDKYRVNLFNDLFFIFKKGGKE